VRDLAQIVGSAPYDASIKGHAGDWLFKHPNGQNRQRPITDAKAARRIISRLGVIEPVSEAVPRKDKTAHRAVVLYGHNAEIPVAALNSQLGATKQC